MLALSVTPAAAQQRIVEVGIENSLLDSLDALADGATLEHVRCLMGVERNDTLWIDHMYEPKITIAAPDSVVTAPCSKGTIALWHNHTIRPESVTPPEERCFLSPTDITTALRGHAFIWIVQVTRDVVCWWTHPQIAILVKYGPVILPIEGQVGRIPRRGKP